MPAVAVIVVGTALVTLLANRNRAIIAALALLGGSLVVLSILHFHDQEVEFRDKERDLATTALLQAHGGRIAAMQERITAADQRHRSELQLALADLKAEYAVKLRAAADDLASAHQANHGRVDIALARQMADYEIKIGAAEEERDRRSVRSRTTRNGQPRSSIGCERNATRLP